MVALSEQKMEEETRSIRLCDGKWLDEDGDGRYDTLEV